MMSQLELHQPSHDPRGWAGYNQSDYLPTVQRRGSVPFATPCP
jgi:hypothetical protein